MWIKRDISSFIEQNTDPIQIVRGPRQCGKSSLILHIDPELFLRQFNSQKLFIDEAQYAYVLLALSRR